MTKLNTLKTIHGDLTWLFRKKTIKCGNVRLVIDLPKLCDLIVENRDGIVMIDREYSIYDRYKLTKFISDNLNKFLKVVK